MIGRLSIFAVFLGLVASTLVGAIVGVVGGVILALYRPSDFEWLTAPGSTSPNLSVTAMILIASLAGAIAAGYASARHAVGDELVNASATGLVLLLLTVAGYEEPWFHQIPLWCTLAIGGLSLPLSLLGGYLQRGNDSAEPR